MNERSSVPSLSSLLLRYFHFQIIPNPYNLELGKYMFFIINRLLGVFFTILNFHMFMDP